MCAFQGETRKDALKGRFIPLSSSVLMLLIVYKSPLSLSGMINHMLHPENSRGKQAFGYNNLWRMLKISVPRGLLRSRHGQKSDAIAKGRA